ncbi:MAG TPA: AMP-binding protein [Patescibacteria group bacterium]
MAEWNKLAYKPIKEWKDIQLTNLRYVSRFLLPFQPFVQNHPEKSKYLSVRSLKDFQKLPFTSKLDLLPTETNPKRSRDFILQPSIELIRKAWPKSAVLSLGLKKLFGTDVKAELSHEFKPVHIHFTTGRSTSQIPFLYTAKDLETLRESGGRVFETIGATSDDIAINAFPFAPHLAFWLAYNTTTSKNMMTLQTGGGKILGTRKIMDAIENLQATILIIMPGYGYHLLREAVAEKRNFSSLRIIVFGGERVSPGLRRKVKSLLNKLGAKHTKVLSTYALTEAKTAWVQCHEESGYHLYPDLEMIELVDRHGNPVKEGSSGEIVYTSLGWRGSVVTRYRTGDFCKKMIITAPCDHCGRTTPRLHSSIERRSDMVELNLTKVKGELVNLNALHSIMHEIPSIEEWQAEVRKKNDDPYEIDELILNIAFTDEKVRENDMALLQSLLQRDMGISATINSKPLKEVIQLLGLETELKEKRIVDRRKEIRK